MRSPSRRLGKAVGVAVTPVAILAAAAMIYQSSYAAFTSTTRNSGNDWSTGQVTLTDDDSGAARFQVANMLPGQTDTKCIKVTANATVPGTVKGYAVNPVNSSQGLEDHILITLSYGTGGSFGSCTGFVSQGTLATSTPLRTIMAANSFATGMDNWAVAGGVPGGESRTYRVTWTFDSSGLTQSQLDNLQNTHTGLDFQWELQTS